MRINKGGQYLKAEVELKGKVITFVDEGAIEVSDKYRYKNEDGTEGDFRKSLVFTVLLNGEEKKIRMNTASRVACHDAWGNESKDWIRQKAIIHILKTPNGDKNMIVLDPIVDTMQKKDITSVTDSNDIDWKD